MSSPEKDICCNYERNMIKYLIFPIFITLLSIPAYTVKSIILSHVIFSLILILTITYFLLIYKAKIYCKFCDKSDLSLLSGSANKSN
jgi:hypothetical protein